MSPVLVAPSILAANFTALGQELQAVERAGADWLHVDIMDGHFVPNITIGPAVVEQLRQCTELPLDVHLMIDEPSRYIAAFVEAGADSLTVHAEVKEDIGALINQIRECGKQAGVSVRPQTPISVLEPWLEQVDLVLLMTVNPGFGGQDFMTDVLPKIAACRKQYSGHIEVDGGINATTARDAVMAGADVLVAGTYVFGAPDYRAAIAQLRAVGKEA